MDNEKAQSIRVAVAGCGFAANHIYLPNLTTSPFANVVSICDVDEERARITSKRFNILRWSTNIADMIDHVKFELLVNLTPTSEHARVNLAGLESSHHVFSEKPLAIELSQGRELLQVAKERDVQFAVAPHVTPKPFFRALRQIVVSGEIGKIHSIHARYADGPPHSPVRAIWFYKKGAGVFYDLGTYPISLLTGLLGPIKSVVALSGTVVPYRFTSDRNQFSVTADDNTVALADFGNCCFATIQTGFSYGANYGEHKMEIVGTGGGVRLQGWEPQMIEIFNQNTSRWEIRPVPTEHSEQDGATYLARCLATGTEYEPTAEQAYHVLEVIVRTLESAQTGRLTPIDSSFPWTESSS